MTNIMETGSAIALSEQESHIPVEIRDEITSLFAEMKAQGVDEIVVDYSGDSDAGEFAPGYAGEMDVDIPVSLSSLAENLAQHAVHSRHSGWENNAGGRGTVTFLREEQEDSMVEKICVEHVDFYDDATTESHPVLEGENAEDFGTGDLKVALTMMKIAGIDEIHVSYSGGGDSGDIDDIQSWMNQGLPGRHSQVSIEIGAELETIIRRIVVDEAWQPWYGWWNNDGGSGNVYFRLKEEATGFPFIFCEHTTNSREEEGGNYDYYAGRAALSGRPTALMAVRRLC